MKKSIYTPDGFMSGLYDKFRGNPYGEAKNAEDALAAGEDIRRQAREIFAVGKLGGGSRELKKIGKPLDYPEYTLQKYSFELCEGLKSAVYILTPKKIISPAPAVVALCGHGYGVRQILNITKSDRKKKLPYIDSYQKSFAVELAKRGCTVAAPELFGFGEARLEKDLKKPFYISSCDELSHHLLPYGLSTAAIRVMQASACADILLNMSSTDPKRLGCMGISGGGLTALYASVTDERFRRTVISCYVNTFRSSILSLWHCPDNYIPRILETGEIYDFAASIAPRELLIESGKKDKLFPIEASLEAHEKIRRIYELTGAQDKLTIDVFNGKHSVSGNKSFEFLSR